MAAGASCATAATLALACPALGSASTSSRCAPVSASAVSRIMGRKLSFAPHGSGYRPRAAISFGVRGPELTCAYGHAVVYLSSARSTRDVSIKTLEQSWTSSDYNIRPYRGLGTPAFVASAFEVAMVAVRGSTIYEAVDFTAANTFAPTPKLAALTKLAMKLRP
jgi:hypothetical protein